MIRACDNPFAVHRVLQQRYRFDDDAWARLLAQFERQGFRGAIVGPHGSGKTTLLEDLAERLAVQGWRRRWVRLSRERPSLTRAMARGSLSNLGAHDVVLLDGAEQLGVLAWCGFRWRTRKAGGVVITTHREGRLPTLWRCETSSALLGEIVGALGVRFTAAEMQSLHARHAGNLREALRELYDRVASGEVAASAWSGAQNSSVVVKR
jgi:hypothetical protein